MTDTSTHNWRNVAIYTAIGVLIGFLLASQFECNDDPARGTIIEGPGRTVVYRDTDTVTTTRIVYRDRWHVVNAPARTVYDTTRESVTTPPYIARLDTITPTHDTLAVAFHHPEQTFDLDYRPRPDSMRTVTIETINVVSVPDKDRIGFGISGGFGAMQAIDGSTKVGAYVGIGINFNIWEP